MLSEANPQVIGWSSDDWELNAQQSPIPGFGNQKPSLKKKRSSGSKKSVMKGVILKKIGLFLLFAMFGFITSVLVICLSA